jgi:hypothetical protein
VERGGVRPRRRRGEVVGGDRAQGLVQRSGHGVPLLQLLLLLLLLMMMFSRERTDARQNSSLRNSCRRRRK